MSLHPLGFSVPQLRKQLGTDPAYVLTQRPLHRVLSFLGYSIDDVINDPLARNQVCGYFKLQCQIQRRSEVVDLERSWNAVGMRL